MLSPKTSSPSAPTLAHRRRPDHHGSMSGFYGPRGSDVSPSQRPLVGSLFRINQEGAQPTISPYEEVTARAAANKRKYETADSEHDAMDRKRPAFPESPSVFWFHGEEPVQGEGGHMEDNMLNRCSAAASACNEKHLKTLDDYFPSLDRGPGSHHLYSGRYHEESGASMDITHACVNCQQSYFPGELMSCNFCLKDICSICDSTCRRCGLCFCRNCSTILYTQFSEDLVCLDCARTVHCIS